MKLLIFLFICWANAVAGQVTITAGAQLSMAANAQLTLENMDLVNNGNFSAGNGTVRFTGNTISSISGSQAVQFYTIEINKTSGSSVRLQRGIGVTQQISFTGGFLNLNGFDANLGSTGILNGEQENSRIIGTAGGWVVVNAILNAPASNNPGNLGAVITSSKNLGSTTIFRGHSSQVNGNNAGKSITRFYDIIPANNSALNATLRINYFDSELNGLAENALELWKSSNNSSWTGIGYNTRSGSLNYVEKTGLADFSRLTLSSVGNALPVHFILFNVNCQDNTIKLTWKTAQEQNSLNFQVQKSNDGIHFATIGTTPASGTNGMETTYSWTDNSPSFNTAFYRIVETDLDGRMQYTSINRTQCNILSDESKTWPNPVGQMLFINVNTINPSPISIKIFDSKGALVHNQSGELLKGSNQVNVNMSRFASGNYSLSLDWLNGQKHKIFKLVKQ